MRHKDALKQIQCNVCEERFTNKTELNTHKLKSHKSWKLCIKHFSTDPRIKCLHNLCHYSHILPSEGKHRCYNCGREFTTLEDLMLHRKSIHNAVCRLYLKNECERDQESCWFNHPENKKHVPVTHEANVTKNEKIPVTNVQPVQSVENNEQGFQDLPTVNSPNINQMMEEIMKHMKSEMAKMFQTMMDQSQN